MSAFRLALLLIQDSSRAARAIQAPLLTARKNLPLRVIPEGK